MDNKKKEGRYARLYKQLQALLTATKNTEARMATIAAVLHHKMDHFFWTGFYCLDQGVLTVRSYQGPVACQVLKTDTGVCWAAIRRQEIIIVADVHQFDGHIACDPRSQSEIVIPVKNPAGEIFGVMDVDSNALNAFDETDARWLQKIVDLL
jgi:GAF domain-containing protein